MLDSQARNDSEGFQQNGGTGRLVHGLLGWDKLIPESMAMYQAGRPTFRLASKPRPEANVDDRRNSRWYSTMVASYRCIHEDSRMYQTAEPIFRWHKTFEEYLINRRPLATIGVVWSQQNMDFYGREDPEALSISHGEV